MKSDPLVMSSMVTPSPAAPGVEETARHLCQGKQRKLGFFCWLRMLQYCRKRNSYFAAWDSLNQPGRVESFSSEHGVSQAS